MTIAGSVSLSSASTLTVEGYGPCVSMLYLIGLGLGDAKDITVKGLEIVKEADVVFLEAYTSILCVGKEVLVSARLAIWTG